MPADHATLSALKARVEAATGPDRELDAEIWWAFADHSETDEDFMAHAAEHGAVSALNQLGGRLWHGWTEMVPIVAGSMDATWALVERQPEYRADPEGFFSKLGAANEGPDMDFSQPVGPQVAQGMLLALLTAKIAQLEVDHAR